MILELHLCGPRGDGQRHELDRALALVQLDNRFLIQAMLRAGRPVPEKVEELGILWRPPSRAEALTDRQAIRGLRAMLEHGSFSCCDAAGWEAAVLEEKYRLPARSYNVDVVPPWMRRRWGAGADGLFHAAYETPRGVVDPVWRYLVNTGQADAEWEALT